MKKAIYLLVFAVSLFLVWSNVSYAQNRFIDAYNLILPAQPASGGEIIDLMRSIAGFLIIAGGVLAGIAIVASGLMFMFAGSNPQRLTTAKAIFKNGIIGALILFAAGIIVNTIIALATNWQTFFS